MSLIRALSFVGAALLGLSGAGLFAQGREMPPAWAYVLPPLPPGVVPPQATAPRAPTPTGPTSPDPDVPLIQAAGSKLWFPQTQINDSYGPPDWFPDEHPPMPDIVAHGKPGLVRACATCHLADGRGKPENAPLQGLPIDSFVQQMHDFQNGLRRSADPRKGNTLAMESYAKAMTEDEIRQAAEYYSAINVSRALRVIESDTVPTTRIEAQVYVATDDGRTEPLGTRVMEIVDDELQLAIRNPKTGFTAYVPVGSISRGNALATTGNGKVTPCTACHLQNLQGIGPIPNLAGRSPTYLARQLFDMKLGTRRGPLAVLMAPVVARLTDGDIVDLAAYMASVEPE
jgi:cytochrome c553